MHARKQAILTRSDPIPSLRPGIDTSKRKKWQRSIRQPAQQPASQPQRSRNAHHLARPGSGGLPQESTRVDHASPGSATRPRALAERPGRCRARGWPRRCHPTQWLVYNGTQRFRLYTTSPLRGPTRWLEAPPRSWARGSVRDTTSLVTH